MTPLRVRILPFLLSLGFAPMAAGQTVLRLREREAAGKVYDLGPSRIIDINSTLLITIDREELRRIASTRVAPAQGVAQLLDRLAALVRLRDKALATIAPALVAWNSSSKDTAAQRKLHEGLDAALSAALEIMEAAPRGGRLRNRLNTALAEAPSGAAQLYGVVFDVAASEAQTLRVERDSLLQAAGIFVQVGGWSVTEKGARSLHFPGFDEHPSLEAFDVENFGIGVIPLTDAQKQQLKQAQELARNFNEQGAGAGIQELSSGLRSAAGQLAVPLLTQVSVCGEQIRPRAEALLRLPRGISQSVKQQLQAAVTSLDSVRTQASNLKAKYSSVGRSSGPSMEMVLEAADDDLKGLYASFEAELGRLLTLQGELTGLRASVRREAATALERLRAGIRECGDSLQIALSAARSSATAILNNLLGVREINSSILAFTESVLRLDIDHVPESIEFRLRYAGERRDGDRLLVRAIVGAAGETSPAQEEYELTMFRVQPHLETVVGLIFADPLGRSELRGRFQAGPSYSVLLKRGSRRSILRNRLLTLGYGLNVAALDFDHDDTPELAAAGVLSLLGDYLQGGAGYNVPRDRLYWFFGLRLPIPTFSLPGATGVD